MNQCEENASGVPCRSHQKWNELSLSVKPQQNMEAASMALDSSKVPRASGQWQADREWKMGLPIGSLSLPWVPPQWSFRYFVGLWDGSAVRSPSYSFFFFDSQSQSLLVACYYTIAILVTCPQLGSGCRRSSPNPGFSHLRAYKQLLFSSLHSLF